MGDSLRHGVGELLGLLHQLLDAPGGHPDTERLADDLGELVRFVVDPPGEMVNGAGAPHPTLGLGPLGEVEDERGLLAFCRDNDVGVVRHAEATDRKHAVSYARRFLQGREAEDVEDGEGESDDCWLFDERGGPALAWARLIEGVLELPIVDWRTDIVHARADAKHRAATSAQATAEKAELRRLLAKYGTV